MCGFWVKHVIRIPQHVVELYVYERVLCASWIIKIETSTWLLWVFVSNYEVEVNQEKRALFLGIHFSSSTVGHDQ